MQIQPVILSGGAGTRLWPLSRELFPKQLLSFHSANTLLQDTVTRLDALATESIPLLKPMVVCNEEHRFLVAEQIRHIGKDAGQIILEPAGRNTAPALTVAAYLSVSKGDDPLLLVMPADHAIIDLQAFRRAAIAAMSLAKSGRIVTFGIVPTKPETGYGYIRKGEAINKNDAYTIDSFVEKPDADTAKEYLASGDYYWNSGMFVMRASDWLTQIEMFAPEIASAAKSSIDNATSDLDFCRLDAVAFKQCPSDSIDYAVMEKLDKSAGHNITAVVPLDAGWSDLGSWSALWETGNQDEQGNVIHGDVLAHNSKNNLLHADHRLVASVGVEDLLVIETADAVLVANRNSAEQVKQIVEKLKLTNREERLVHREVFRPWGSYEGVVAGDRFQVKRIVVKPGAQLSLQMHHHRAEHWIVVKGTAKVTCGEKEFLLSENQSTYIPIGEKHRLTNPGTLPLEIIEVQSGSYLGEDDIVRFEDVYGRSK